jgi:hypothetical protein
MLNDGKLETAPRHIICFYRWMKDVSKNRKTHFVQLLLCPLVHNILYCCFKLKIGNVYSAIQVEMHWNTAVLQSEATKAEAPSWPALRIFRLFSFSTRVVKGWKFQSGAHKLFTRITVIKIIEEFLHLCLLPGFPLFFRVMVFLKESFEHTMNEQEM